MFEFITVNYLNEFCKHNTWGNKCCQKRAALVEGRKENTFRLIKVKNLWKVYAQNGVITEFVWATRTGAQGWRPEVQW